MKLNLGDLISYKGYKSTDEIQFGMIVKIFEDFGDFGPWCCVEWGQAGLKNYSLEALNNCVHFRGSRVGITGWCLVLKYDSHDSIALKLDSTQHHD